MPARYSCFISYAHGRGRLITSFITELQKALTDELDAYVNIDLWIDRTKLGTGDELLNALPRAICASACVIVVFVPKYTRKEWCLRELAMARQIEEERLPQLRPHLDRENRLVLPIVLRGEKRDIPDYIRTRIWADFSQFSIRDTDLRNNPALIEEIEKLAKHIHRVCTAMEAAEATGADLCGGCDVRVLSEPMPVAPLHQAFPLRADPTS